MAAAARGDGEAEEDQAAALAAAAAFVAARCAAGVDALLDAAGESDAHALPVDFLEAHDFDEALGEALYWQPERTIQALERAAVGAQADALRAREERAAAEASAAGADPASVWDDAALGSVKRAVRARVTLPRVVGCAPPISALRARDAGRLLSVRGTAVRTGPVKAIEAEKEFRCPCCKQHFLVSADLEAGGAIEPPESCPVRPGCRGVSFAPVEDAPRMSDFQEVKLQELLSEVGVGRVPASVVVLLEADHAGAFRAGEDLEVCGYLTRRWQPPSRGRRCDVEMALRACRVARLGRRGRGAGARASPAERRAFEARWESARARGRELAERDALLRAVCPQVHGMALAKLAVVLTVIGGVARESASGARVRGESHLLVVGDAGMGKSQLLRAAANLAPRATVTTGCGSTAAGLTAAAVKDGGEWALEAGALVLGDGGLCCIDEFDSMKEQDRAAIHEALEQQTVSVAKAGVVSTLRARTAVFAVTNPKGTYDRALSLDCNTSLGGPLLSRFDMVLVLPDVQKPEWDAAVADHILAVREVLVISCLHTAAWIWRVRRSAHSDSAFLPVLTSVTAPLGIARAPHPPSPARARRRSLLRGRARAGAEGD